MLRTLLSFVLVGLLTLGLNTAPVMAAQGNDDAKAVDNLRLKVAKVGVGEKARVTVRMKDGTKIKGIITQAGTDDFSVRDGKTGDPRIILYRDVARIEDNRGHSTLRNVLIGVGIGAAAVVAFIAIVFASLND
jgi:hypothetical protein